MKKSAFLLLFILVSCKSDITSTNQNENAVSEKAKVSETKREKLSDDPVVKRAEKYLTDLSEAIENFGGVYYDSNEEFVIKIKDYDSRLSNESEIKNRVRARIPAAMNRNSRISSAEFTFKELVDIRDVIYDEMKSLDINFLDLAEDKNRIVIGTNTNNKNEIIEYLRSNNIPINSVLIEKMSKTQPLVKIEKSEVNDVEKYLGDNSEITTLTLADYVRPSLGGTNLTGKRNYGGQDYNIICTMGFSAKWNNQNVFITNSHCTEYNAASSQTWEEDPLIRYYLPDSFDSPTNQGEEILDPFGTSSGCSGWNDKCRYSDAAIIKYKNINSSDIGHGKIAKTTYRGINWSDGNNILPSTDYEWRIISQDKTILLNMPLNKVGRTTGWTHGYVSNTCVTEESFFGNHKDLKCQYFVSGMKAAGGDSGSPVFYNHTTPQGDVELVGILYGVRTTEQKAAFSPISGIEEDMNGPIDTADPPITVYITGSGLIESTGNYTWYSNVQEEDGAVSYQWKIKWDGSSVYTNLGTSPSQTINISNDTDFTLKLIVTDSADSAEDIFPVTVTFGGGCSPTNPCGF